MDFTRFVKKMRKSDISKDGVLLKPQLVQVLLGLQEEVGELSQLHSKQILYGKHIDPNHLLSEAGDVLHYLVSIVEHYNFTLEDVIEYNVSKIKGRGIRDGD